MKKRIPYMILFFLVLGLEILIGLFVRDRWIRPYGGDLLVAVLICAFVRCFFPEKRYWIHGIVFLFCAAVECIQCLDLGLSGSAAVSVGSTFDWADLLCYALGCGLFAAAELLLPHIQRKSDLPSGQPKL